MGARPGTMIGLLVMGWTVSACSTAGPSAAGSTTAAESTPAPSAAPTPADPGQASPAPSASPSPTADPRPALEFPDYQSFGSATISFSSPALPAVIVHLVCLWSPAYNPIVALDQPSVALAGEQVDLWIGPHGSEGMASVPWPPFTIHRHGAASYVAGPKTGTVEVIDFAEDESSGAIRFDGLAPDLETAPLGPIQLADWGRPLGGDPVMATLTGTVTWLCEPAPPTLPTPDEQRQRWADGSPMPPSFDLPARRDPDPLLLVSGDQRQPAVDACGGIVGDQCWGADGVALDADHLVRIPTGGLLRFELPDAGSHFLHWSLLWVTQNELERWHGEGSEPGKLIDEGGTSEGPVLEFAAPPAGDWTVVLGWTDDRDDAWGDISSYFRVVVGD